ncbi:MAG TPA: plastocyanin/azurin family copper-binding protein [Actinomycetota bacterium]|nr:plastocyanin/azurin family copper-binding protein [Actinomycetota bacterium]
MSAVRRLAALVSLVSAFGIAAPAGAVHFYRGPGSGCTPADGARSDGGQGEIAATVNVLHNTFADAATALPVTRINAGEAIRWTWNSVHCHSVQAAGFYSGFHYPAPEPGSPRALPGVFDYPMLEENPTFSFTVTFDTPGTYSYVCEHHAAIGMAGLVVVE